MRCLVIVLALLVGLGSTDAFAKDAVLVKLRDDSKPAAKPTPTKSAVTRAKKKPVRRTKAVAKTKPKPKKKSVKKTEKPDEPRLRPMP